MKQPRTEISLELAQAFADDAGVVRAISATADKLRFS
jgi:hypothetical protein